MHAVAISNDAHVSTHYWLPAVVSVLFALAGAAVGAFDLIFLNAIPGRFFGVVSNEVLVAVPLFVFMGVMLERSRVAEEPLTTMGQCFGPLRGGLGISVTGSR
jgi:TRAP-type mannitol/chloroaromatic compound transport system permease large subunit